MRIRTLLIGGTIASGALVAVVVGYLAVAVRSLDTSLEQDTATGALIVSLYEQSEILGDYLLHPGERARSQWTKKQAHIGQLIDRLAVSAGDDDPLLSRMQANQAEKAISFAWLVNALEDRGNKSTLSASLNELEQHRIAQVRLASQSMLTLAVRLGQQAEDRLLDTLYELAWGVALLVGSIGALLAGVWFIVGWRVVRPIVRLQHGIRNFRGGRVGDWQGIRTDDEIGDVATAFEAMAENLNAVMVSRNELAKEVETRKRAERQAQEYAESLKVRTSELDAVNRELETFAYSVSHDLRAPLRSMAGFCQALVEDYNDRLDDTGKDFIRRISDASKRMGLLIDDLLTLSRVTRKEVNKADVDLSEMAQTIAEQLRQAEPARDVAFEIQPGITASGDETLLRTVLENLLGNAWKYSSKKPQATIEFGVAANGGGPSYYVRDNGVGFDMAHADKLFKPFQRLHRAAEFEGTGIGLASVANIIRRHGGKIWAEAAPDAGATLRFTLAS
jgi:signal transduction histidine kinase